MSCPNLSKDYGIKGYPECSGHGSCVQGLCVCDIGWSDIGDMALKRGYDCDINVLTLTVWNSINLVTAAIATVLVLYFSIKENIFSQKNIYSLKTLVFISYLSCNVFGCIYISVKLQNPGEIVIGDSSLLSALCVFVVFPACTGVSNYFIIFVKFLKSYSRFFDPKTRRYIHDRMFIYAVIARCLPFFTAGCLVISLVSALYTPPAKSDMFNILFYASFLFAYVLYSYIVITILELFTRELKNYLDSQKDRVGAQNIRRNSSSASIQASMDIINLYERISRAKSLATPALLSGIPSNALFASLAILRRKQTYLLLLEFNLTSIIALAAVMSLSTSSSASVSPTPTQSDGFALSLSSSSKPTWTIFSTSGATRKIARVVVSIPLSRKASDLADPNTAKYEQNI